MFKQLNPPMPITMLDQGNCLAIAFIDYGLEHNLTLVTALDNSGEIWCAPNPKVRLQADWTAGRMKDENIHTFSGEGATA